MSSLLKTANKVKGVTNLELQDEFSTLFMAGQETTASMLAFHFNTVGRRPDILEK